MTTTKKTKATEVIYTAQQKQAVFDQQTKGQGEAYKARYNALFVDSRSWAIASPDGECAAPASLDMLNCVTGHKKFGFTPDVNAQIEKLDIDVSRMYRPGDAMGEGCNMKSLKRFHQMMHSFSNAAAPHMGCDTVSTIILLALLRSDDKPLTNDAIFYLGVGKNRTGTSADLRGVNRTEVINKILSFAVIKDIEPKTMQSQTSRSIGEDGFLSNVGAVERIKTGRASNDWAFKINRNNALVKHFEYIFNNLTNGQLESYADEMKLTS